MRLSAFTRDLLLLFAGPLVWAVHFVAIYGFNGILCARPALSASWLGVGIATWGIVGAGLVALAAVGACLALSPNEPDPETRRFLRWLSVGLGLLAMVAIAWETVTVLLVPACG